MSDAPTGPEPAASAGSRQDLLLAVLANAVVTVPGVVRLEPTLSTAGPGVLLHRSTTDGIRLLDRAGVVDVDVAVATTAACQARAVTHQVRDCITSLLREHGRTPGSIAVSVLSINPVDAPAEAR